ncbi:hypothetical protein LIER_21344 [Lithospermum erythrorhizon]|uniref:Integrase catalytic domain-containing protein n=1 Tax=Lithospermum erythrorhizon TaxID=34254 RepID=A0AAV3QU21_LITER
MLGLEVAVEMNLSQLEHVPRKNNKQGNALATLASSLVVPGKEVKVAICEKWVIAPLFEVREYEYEDEKENVAITTTIDTSGDWWQPFIDYLQHEKIPDDPPKKVDILRRAPRFLYYNDTLFRRSFEEILQGCLPSAKANQAMKESHSGVCGVHESGAKLPFQIKRMGYYWPTMYHANFIHQSLENLHPTTASWPFDGWVLDMVGPLPNSSGGYVYILVGMDYFSKWVEVVPLRQGEKKEVAKFITSNLIHRYEVPRYIIIDNGKPFDNKLISSLYSKFKFKKYHSSITIHGLMV